MDDIQKHILAERALAVARRCVTSRFAGAAFAYVAGSLMRGDGTAFSDIDLVVVFPSLERASRESFTEDGFPVEAFVHDEQTLAHYLHADAESGCPVMVTMVATGSIVGLDFDSARIVQARAASMLAAGPKPLAGASYDMLRYHVTDLADDLRGSRPPEEIAAIAAQLYQKLADLILLGRGAWAGRGKWAPRLIRALDAQLAIEFDAAFRLAAEGDATRFLALADRELALHGGRYFEGFRQDAPMEARRLE
ncbi:MULTISPECIES: nucleotidyltransferase domain-containing protein [unclassified Rhizobium]|uniref:nucleotidyltransferase domain-containing protein n=1 Tax=unclassified Rhizobium TaxID=2613769 RepID=UPI001A989BBD|nr:MULTISPECIES: nucleotidyltransferase domain-containing protein [unclassified Rhizobium]MBX5167941.1 nucleotidyltransferase domain-containing protein [Rhizobium sp. NZLR4b]MBX5186124.1 nucleotidyltransferase domain-containing protein [Rhizobium sp. NZLR5]MBX5193287.1 nucleotidyltransferase domain-containing protein [Rhizobium sp. NZLR3b]MBX5203200.1 nucleotidyltransferase domain-containing protein [Rhizobium sp. NZLR1]MBX5212063.1 nucleotidyltransferase domain-containing protein [Rhizobium s